MSKFIKLNEHVVNVDQVAKAEFISNDIYMGLFPDKFVDYIPFIFGIITLKSGEEISLDMDLYRPEPGQSKEEWRKLHTSYINRMWRRLMNALDNVDWILGLEYEEA